MDIFAFDLFDKWKKYQIFSFSNFVKIISGHDMCCVPFLESACNTENNDTKHNIEFRILSTSTMQ